LPSSTLGPISVSGQCRRRGIDCALRNAVDEFVAILSMTIAQLVAVQRWPVDQAPWAVFSTTRSIRICQHHHRILAAHLALALRAAMRNLFVERMPTGLDPVKETALTAGCPMISSPALSLTENRLSTPGGRPASSKSRRSNRGDGVIVVARKNSVTGHQSR
jgi:hypothetical protein